MLKKAKVLLLLFVCISALFTVMQITAFAEGNAASVTFGESTEYYATIDAAWEAAVALDTTAENKATIKLLDNCTAENTLTNTEDYLVLDTNGKTLTTPDAIAQTNDVLCGIGSEGGSLEITGNGTITGLSSGSFARAIILITGGEVYANGVTVHNTGKTGSISVLVNGGSFHLLDGYLLTSSEYALDAEKGNVYLYSGKIESTGRLAASFNYVSLDVQICYSDKPLYFVDNDAGNWALISSTLKVHLADNLIMDLEYSDNPDGSDSKTVKNVTEIDTTANTDRNYLKIQTYKKSCLFSTSVYTGLLTKVKKDGITEYGANEFTAVHFVDLEDYDLTGMSYSDYSANGDGSVKAWVDGTELYIGGYGKIIAGDSLAYAFNYGKKIDRITGLEMLDTSNVTDMKQMFADCGYNSQVFTLDLGNNFDTSNVTDMQYMFWRCGNDCPVFTLDLGDNFDTSNVTNMKRMFLSCGRKTTEMTLDLGDKFDTSKVTDMEMMFDSCGNYSTVFTLNLGDKFDTSNVTDMGYMFSYCGYKSQVFTLDLGDKFDTSKVTNMKRMFDSCGYSSQVFTLDLGDKFDTSNVTDMSCMFLGCGQYSPVFTLDLGDMFDTYNVTNMSEMFYFCGYKSTEMTLDLGDKFDTSNVTDMSKMFWMCGYTSTAFTLDFKDKFDTSNVINMSGMLRYCGKKSSAFTTLDLSAFTLNENTDLNNFADNMPVTTFIFGEGWANATLPSGAFYADKQTATEVVGATPNLIAYDWAGDNRAVSGLETKSYVITAKAETGGTVSGGGEVTEGESITLTATANDGYTFDGWYDGETKVCDTAEFTVGNVTADKTYTAKFTKNQVEEPDTEFDFTTIRTLRAKDIYVDHKAKTITMTADGNVKNIAVFHDQSDVIPGGTIKLADAKDVSVKQNPGSFYIVNNAGTAAVTVDVTVGEVTKQYTLSVNFNEFVAENLRMYQRKLGSTQKDIVYGTDAGYVAGNEIHITPDAGIEYIGLTKYQGTPGNYNGVITPVGTYPTYSTFEESTSSQEPVFVDWQGCIFVKRPTDGTSVEFDVNYTIGTQTSVYKVIVDFTQETEFAFSTVRSVRAKNISVNHSAKTITMDSDGRVSNIAVYKYQLGEQSNMQITLADKLSADVTQNDGSFYINNTGDGTASVVVDVNIGGITKQYTLTVNFEDGFDFTGIRTLRTKNITVDHETRTITLDSDGAVSNIAVYKAQNDIIKDGSIVLSDALSASVVQNEGSFYIKDDGTGSASVAADVTIGKVTKQYTLKVNFADGFDFDSIRALRASEIVTDHDAQTITITAVKGAKNVALYMSQTGVISGGRLTLTDEMNSEVQRNPGSYYIVKQADGGESKVSADIKIGGKTKTYEITVLFAD